MNMKITRAAMRGCDKESGHVITREGWQHFRLGVASGFRASGHHSFPVSGTQGGNSSSVKKGLLLSTAGINLALMFKGLTRRSSSPASQAWTSKSLRDFSAT